MPIGMCPRCGMPLGKPHSFPCCNDPKPLAADRSTRSPAAREEVDDMQAKNARNARVQARYDELMREGKHGHYETMFRVVREEVEADRATRATAATREGSDEAMPIGFMSPQQLPIIQNGFGDAGTYIPIRKTPAGNFTLPLFTAAQSAQAALEGTEEWAADVLGISRVELSVSEFSAYQRERMSCVIKGYRASVASRSASDARAVPEGTVRIELTDAQLHALYLTLLHDRPRPAFGWMEQPLVEVQAILEPLHGQRHDANFPF